MDDMKFGIEAEHALIRPDGRFADFTNTEYAEVQPLIARLPDYRHPELRVGDAGIRVKNWYVEGDERFDEFGQSTGLSIKGIEVRTPVCATIDHCMASLRTLREMLKREVEAQGWGLAAIGFNPCTDAYRPDYAPWEKEFHASHIGNALPEISTLSFGPDLNFSRRGDTAETAIETARRLTWYSPYIVPFSFSAPFAGGGLWEGLSFRTFQRTGPRPAALVHLAGRHDHPLAKQADPESHHLRIEFKAFDMVDDDALLAELFHLVVGISLADEKELPGCADAPDCELHRRVAVSGFEEDAVHAEAGRLVRVARASLRSFGRPQDFPLLDAMLATRRTPAHAMRESFLTRGLFLNRL
jgi:hypothetical protein